MKGIMRKLIYFGATAALAMSASFVSAFVPVHINSGNPKFPFPQFLPYEYGDSHRLENLGTINPEGVVHAEMEQDIRDAYQIFANEWTYTGEEVGGVKYIKGNNGCPYDCREGDGYALLAAAVMGDKVSFDGLWMRMHDRSRNKQPSFKDGTVLNPDYGYGNNTLADNTSDAATDGDIDICLAIYIAWKQWGDDSGIKVFGGKTFSYFDEMVDVIHGLVEVTTRFPADGEPRRHNSGDIGLDGYMKGGNTWAEITRWATQNPQEIDGVMTIPEFAGSCIMHVDYLPSGYFDEFYNLFKLLKSPKVTEYEINQFKRGAASGDWIVGRWIEQNPKNIFMGELLNVKDDNTVELLPGNQGGRFRSAWRTSLNYTWHGNPDYSWDPDTHQWIEGGNEYELNASKQLSGYMNDPQGWGGIECTKYGGGPSVHYKGPSTLNWNVQPDGKDSTVSTFTLNWVPGTGMASAINAKDLDLAGLLYRQCNIEWDVDDEGDGYLTSVPVYFHGFFRWLGMVIGTGNHIAPSQIVAKPNLKIYRAIKDGITYAYTGDKITYLLDYRNFGSVDAKSVTIEENVPKDFIVDESSISNGGKYIRGSHKIIWDLGTVPGLKSDDIEGPALDSTAPNLSKTFGQVSYSCIIGPNAEKRYCTTAEIKCNECSWVTNEYPNHITSTMQRNCVDIRMRSLTIEKTANVEKVNPDNTVEYRIDFENSSKAGWLDGGRPRVNVAVGKSDMPGNGARMELYFRLYSDAIEPYIDYGNYRIAYYLHDTGFDCLAGTDGCDRLSAWSWNTENYEGRRTEEDQVIVEHKTIVEDEDERGKWNQRLSIQFAPFLVSHTGFVSNYYGMTRRVHRGGSSPLRIKGAIATQSYESTDFTDDWSWNPSAVDAENGSYYPISPSWQEIDPLTGESIEKPVKEYLPSICETPTHVIDNMLVEEYDGYAWRRILGNGPMPGMEAYNVVVIDTLPKGMEFVSFLNECPLAEYEASWDNYQIADGRWVVKWEIPLMQVRQKGSIIYAAKASFPSGKECETEDEPTYNVAWILADKNSPISDTAEVTVTCSKVPKPIISRKSFTKVANAKVYEVGDDIEYTIGYKQTEGSIFENAGKNVSDLTLSTEAQANGTGLVSINKNGSVTFKNSYSKNGYFSFHCVLTKDQGPFEFVFRDKLKLKFDLKTSRPVEITMTDGNSAPVTKSISLPKSEMDIRFKLVDDVLTIWFDKDTSTRAPVSFDNIKTINPGYISISNDGGTQQFSNIHLHSDYAYDLTIVDLVPAEVEFVSVAGDGTGQFFKGTEGDSIVWTSLAENPIAYGDSFTVTWKGKVKECNESIINYAYVTLLGYETGSIMAQAVSGCGNDCEGVQKAELTFKDGESVNTICAGDSAVLVAVGTPASKKYLYQFYLDGEPIGEASKVDTLVVKEPGKYKVKISDPDCPTATTPTSPSVTLTVNALPDEVVPEKSICENESLPIGDVTIDDYTIEWYKDAHTLFAVDVAEIPAEDVVETYFYVLTDVNGCKSEPKPWNVEIKELPSTPIIAEKEIEAPLTAGVTKNITDKVTPSKTGNKIVWYDSEGEAEISAPILVDLSTEGPQKYVVRESQNGCLGDTLSITVVVTSSQKPNPSDTTICVGSQIEVASLVKKEEDAELIWYDENGDEISDPGTYTSTEAGKKTFTVAQKKGEAVSEKTAFTITTVDVAKLKEDVEINYCAGEAAEELKAEVDKTACPNCKTPTSYQWYLNESRTNDLNPNTEVTEKTATYYYHVEPIYQIPNGEKCVGKKVDVNVVVNFVPAVITKSVSYVLTDAVNDKFPSLESAAKPISSDYSIEWYTEDGELIGTTAPSPTMADVDLSKALTTLTYKVKQVKNDCRSEFSTVTVFISKIPTPTVKNAYYCEGDTPDPLSSYVTPSTGYTLVWYNGDPEKGGREDDMPTINTTSQRSGETVKDEIVDKYYVAQRNTEGTSGAVFVEAHIFAKPTIITHDTASCEEPINVNMLWLPKTTRVEFYTKFGEYFRDPIVSETKKGLQLEGVISFTVEGKEKTCRSDRSTINVEIHKLDFDIDAPAEVCPNSEAELNVNMTVKEIEDSTLSYSWKGYAANADNILSDPINKETEFSVTVTDGVCKVTKTKTVGITNGKIDGSIKISEDGSSDPGVNEIATKEGAKFESCGGDVTIVADVAGTDFMWDNAIAGNTITKKGGIYKLKYKDVNGCETGFAVEIIPTPIEDNTIAFDSTICEGESITLVADLTAGVEATNVVWKKDDSEVGNDASLVLKKVTSANAGKYTYEASYKKCKLSGTFGSVTVLPRPTYDFLDVDPVCIGSSEIIGIENLNPTTADIKWDSDPTLIVNGNGMTATVTPVESETTYSFTISQNGGCKIVEKINVSASKPIDFSINGEDTTVCENSIGNLKFGLNIVEGDVLSYEWRDIDKDSVVSSSSVLKFNEKKIGTYRYKVMLTSEACDPQFDDIEVTIAGAPLVDTVTKIDYHNVEIVPNTSYGESPYMYKVDAAEEFSTNEEVYVKYGHHTVVIKDANGCMSSYEFDTQAPDFEIPVVITPNGDGDNDAFMSHVISEAYPDARVTIYDRYGKKLTEIRGDESWDGMYNGHKMPSTDYWYEIWIEEIRKKYVGHFTLINE